MGHIVHFPINGESHVLEKVEWEDCYWNTVTRAQFLMTVLGPVPLFPASMQVRTHAHTYSYLFVHEHLCPAAGQGISLPLGESSN